MLLALVSASQGSSWQVGGSAGAGWLTAPSSDARADDSRPTLVLLGDAWMDWGRITIGGEVTLNFSSKEGSGLVGEKDKETIALTSVVLMGGKWFPMDGVPARVRLVGGAGLLHSWDELDRDGQLYQQESWGPEFHVAAIWERDLGSFGMIRLRLAGINAWTVSSEIIGTGIRTSNDWSRLEFSAGWAYR